MRILYVAPRYHTNQIPIIKGWQEEKDEVMFISQFQAGREDYSLLTPKVLGYSVVFRCALSIYRSIFRKKIIQSETPEAFEMHFGFPMRKETKKILRQYNPDVVILRDRSLYTAMFTHYCRKYGICNILYNQTPFWENSAFKKDLFHRVIRDICPSIRITPVLGKQKANQSVDSNTLYVPFVIDKHIVPEQKQYFQNNIIHVLCVGKFEPRKHHLELLQAIAKMPLHDNIEITLVGESTRGWHKEYLQRVKSLITTLKLENRVIIKTNLSLKQVYCEYEKADVFVLPSTGEFASISQLEAMSCSLAVVCSDTNGTADCVEEGRNGYLFLDNNFEDFYYKLEKILSDRKLILRMGKESYKIIQERYQFTDYKSKIIQIKENYNV